MMTLQKKLLGSFGILLCLVIAISAFSLRSLTIGYDRFTGFVNEENDRRVLIYDFLEQVQARAIGARNLVLVTHEQDVREEERAVVDAHKTIVKDLAKLIAQANALGSEGVQEQALVAEISRVEAKYAPVALGIVKLALDGNRQTAIDKLIAECRPLLKALIEASHAYLDHIDAIAHVKVDEADRGFSVNWMTLSALSVAAVILALLLSWLILRDVMRSLGAEPNALKAAAIKVSSGDLRLLEGISNAPENSVMSSLGDMQRQLATLVGQVREASDSIALGASSISAGNMDLSRRTENQAAALEETASAMEEISSTVRSNAETAREASQLATSASEAASHGGEVVGEVVATMGEIKSSSGQISDIIGVIDGIAFQTNILALNAAVEAARAGEQGRGFAVVATEVRALASRSIEAARQIKELIEVSVGKVEAGASLVTNAGSMMDNIVAQSRTVSGMIKQISTATTEQTTGIEQISGSISDLDQVTQQNAALVEESAAAAETLNQDSSRLAEIVRVFKLTGDHPASN